MRENYFRFGRLQQIGCQMVKRSIGMSKSSPRRDALLSMNKSSPRREHLSVVKKSSPRRDVTPPIRSSPRRELLSNTKRTSPKKDQMITSYRSSPRAESKVPKTSEGRMSRSDVGASPKSEVKASPLSFQSSLMSSTKSLLPSTPKSVTPSPCSSTCSSPERPSPKAPKPVSRTELALSTVPATDKSKKSTSNKGANKYAKRGKFNIGSEVLARWSDGLFYLGNVLKVEEKEGKCFVQFEDNSEYWVLYKDLQKGAKEGEINCCVCQSDVSEAPNEIVLCDNCGIGYHQECHNPTIDDEYVIEEEVEWCCRLCIFAATVKKGGALKIGDDAKALQKMKQTFPYDLNKLTWDAQRKTNVEQCYCYCGGPGDWYLKMLQCCRCKQWFHEACIQCLEHPLLNGDRFYLFVCSHCNSGPEYIKRLDLKWVDIAHLVLFNLTLSGIKKFYDFDVVLAYMTANWNKLQLSSQIAETTEEERQKKLYDILRGHKTRFTFSREVKKKHTYWGLRMRAPPPGPTIILPVDGQINEEVMNSLQAKGHKTKCFVPIQCNSPVPLRYKKNSHEMDESIAFKSDKARKKLMKALENGDDDICSDNQNYDGYDGSLPIKEDQRLVSKNSSSSRKGKSRKKPSSTLENIIPAPTDFESFNHPFKTEIEQKQEFAKHQRKMQIINYLYQSYDSDSASQSSLCSGLSGDDPTKAIPTPPPSVTSSLSTETLSSCSRETHRQRRGKKRKGCDGEQEAVAPRRSKRTRVSISGRYDEVQNVIDTQMIESVKCHVVNMERIKSNISSYFGATDRLKKGEKYDVLAKRVKPGGKVQYLIAWDGIVA
ncbi:metal-response element-binding transcription factor 2-like isoform X2 [Mizuhopecten yessoensis]|uniref:metal-response element-binding transcription factor 2-like isoform X2 n=1 Tax=Mizuhopecten yessoensis TaxID=6573 RepID=UPI000B459D43|nr:metal-response element-binding transcription factor 2-like isoform X2 [Mizuhopecten yessoensis]